MSAAPSTFTPSETIDMSKERDWPAKLGMLDWDNTNIVFTKRSLLEFLKYAGVTVDPNFTNIQKLPPALGYAKFGKISSDSPAGAEAAPTGDDAAAPASAASTSPATVADDFKPTRRVRDPPGGVTHRLFGTDVDDDDALAMAPPKPTAAPEPTDTAATDDSRLKSRRTTSSVAGLWDAPEPDNGFKPTRRVREMPGGKDSISGLFGA
ncbi:hypothetical protein ONZ51_g9282 [Trametes cubensis]|uniref:Uncharacterized protein n=1 Tax=Trametes cubensis TaxID=1111947 RepID=A0AAD7TNH7_9APHY|nr:hypothetical protein ONZ51_g9282 [Trametes cubensis]